MKIKNIAAAVAMSGGMFLAPGAAFAEFDGADLNAVYTEDFFCDISATVATQLLSDQGGGIAALDEEGKFDVTMNGLTRWDIESLAVEQVAEGGTIDDAEIEVSILGESLVAGLGGGDTRVIEANGTYAADMRSFIQDADGFDNGTYEVSTRLTCLAEGDGGSNGGSYEGGDDPSEGYEGGDDSSEGSEGGD